MSRYMETAEKANKVAKSLMGLVTGDWKTHSTKEQFEGEVACHIAQLVNMGVRCNPRPAQGTVRLNAVKKAVEGLPVKVELREIVDEKTGYSFKALSATPKSGSLEQIPEAHLQSMAHDETLI